LVSKPRLHLDAGTAVRALERELLARGHDVTRTPTEWMPADASDEMQLLRATARGRILFTFNIRDFMALAELHPLHAGVVLAAQQSWTLAGLIAALDHLLDSTTAEIWVGQVRWLNDWKK
jgi:Domain of unknown function (DUF5615)